jgi:hypothetical protein
VPASHKVQLSPLGPVEPASQMQSVCSSLAAGALEFVGHVWQTFDVAPTVVEYSPAKQLVHKASPVVTLYVPASHKAHDPPLGPDEPAIQVQAVKDELPRVELV